MDKSTIEDSLAKALEKRRGIKVVTTSSKSGARISHSIWFVQKDGKLYLLPVRGSDSHWYNNVLAAGAVRLAVGAAEYTLSASAITDPAGVAPVVKAFRDKYGDKNVATYYPKTDMAVEAPT